MKVAILDIDNTLFPWLAMWHAAFKASHEVLAPRSSHSPDDLLEAIRELHVLAKTAERGFASSDAAHLGVAEEEARRAGEAFEETAAFAAVLFDGVLDTIGALRDRGIRVALHTDSPHTLAEDRIVALGLDGLVEAAFATEHLDVVVHRSSSRRCRETRFEVLKDAKPAPEALHSVCQRLGVTAKECVYVGDSKKHDIPMARAGGALDVHAVYGIDRDSPEYQLLRKVSHWSLEAIEQEKRLQTMEATHTVTALAEILRFF